MQESCRCGAHHSKRARSFKWAPPTSPLPRLSIKPPPTPGRGLKPPGRQQAGHLPSHVTLHPGAVLPPGSCLDHLYVPECHVIGYLSSQEQVCRGEWLDLLF